MPPKIRDNVPFLWPFYQGVKRDCRRAVLVGVLRERSHDSGALPVSKKGFLCVVIKG